MEKWSHLVPSRTQKLSTSSASIATRMNSESSTLPVKDLYDVEVFLFLIMSYTVKAMITKNERETIELGKKLALALPKGSTIALKGDLAGGKTTFTKGIGEALHVKEVINSPTFTILKIYQGDLPLYHIDAYRLENNDYDLGISEYEDEGIMVVEWPEYYADYLPKEYMEVRFTYIDDDTREIEFIPHGEQYKKILEELQC